jgi:phosphoribosylanthranilate isomerase
VILSGETINSTSVLDIINTVKPMGIELKGGTEISPGLKDFEALSEILELLELDE